MTDGEKAGCWAMAWLLMVLFATWFTIVCIAWYHIVEWFL